VNIAISRKGKRGNPNEQENDIPFSFTQPTQTMISAIQHLPYSDYAPLVTAHTVRRVGIS
jgi:hypothetical protein